MGESLLRLQLRFTFDIVWWVGIGTTGTLVMHGVSHLLLLRRLALLIGCRWWVLQFVQFLTFVVNLT